MPGVGVLSVSISLSSEMTILPSILFLINLFLHPLSCVVIFLADSLNSLNFVYWINCIFLFNQSSLQIAWIVYLKFGKKVRCENSSALYYPRIDNPYAQSCMWIWKLGAATSCPKFSVAFKIIIFYIECKILSKKKKKAHNEIGL